MSARPTVRDKDRVAYSIYEAAEACGLSDATIRRAIKVGDLVAYYPTTRALILKEDLQDWIKAAPNQRVSA